MAKKGRPIGSLSRWWKTKRRVICEVYDAREEDIVALQKLRQKINNAARERAKKC